jgi:hypothetical protein
MFIAKSGALAHQAKSNHRVTAPWFGAVSELFQLASAQHNPITTHVPLALRRDAAIF